MKCQQNAMSTILLVSATILSLLEQGRLLVTAQTCNGDGPCRCIMSDGSGTVDISSLGNQDGTAKFQDSYSYDGVPYFYNPCFSMSVGECKNKAVCKQNGNTYEDQGSQNTAVWSYTGFYPQITYTAASGIKTEIMLICDMSYTSPSLDVFGELVGGTVSMNLWSECACPGVCKRVDPVNNGDEGLTPGSVMLIIFFSCAFVYLAGGMSYNYTKNRAVGKEMLPNYNFWSILPSLIKDGFRFSWDCVCRRQNKGGYEEV